MRMMRANSVLCSRSTYYASHEDGTTRNDNVARLSWTRFQSWMCLYNLQSHCMISFDSMQIVINSWRTTVILIFVMIRVMIFVIIFVIIFCHLRDCGRGGGAKPYCNRWQREDWLDENARERQRGRERERERVIAREQTDQGHETQMQDGREGVSMR